MTEMERLVTNIAETFVDRYPDFVNDVCEAVTRYTLKQWLDLNDPSRVSLKADKKMAKQNRKAIKILLDYSGVPGDE
jgi:hypothetical protein